MFSFKCEDILFLTKVHLVFHYWYMINIVKYIENTSWKVRAYGIYARVVDVSEIERVSAANE